MYSVETDEEALKLLIATCPRNIDGDFVARELAVEQTLDNLYAFGDRLHRVYERMKSGKVGDTRE